MNTNFTRRKNSSMPSNQRGLLACCMVMLLLISTQLLAQSDYVVQGQITSETGETLSGVGVRLLDRNVSTYSDENGNFTISVSGPGTLTFTYVGFLSQNLQVVGATRLNIVMQQDVNNLEEVVVVGYNTQKRINMTGSITTLKPEAVTGNPVGNVSQQLQGNVSGVTVTTNSRPGTDANVLIRGLGTINNNSPLWIIDGVPRDSRMNDLNPNEIESMTVLKDASSTAIYGARGANGVILVTTVKGKTDQPATVSVRSKFGVARNHKRHGLLDMHEYGEMLWLQFRNSGQAPNHPIYGSGDMPVIPKYILPAGASTVDLSLYDPKTYQITEANLNGTDWYDEILQPGITSENSVLVHGGSKKTSYAFSASHLDEGGIVKHTSFERYTLSSNVNTSINDWLSLGQNLRLTNTLDKGLQSEGESGAFGVITQLTPLMPVYDIKGNYAPLSRLTGFDPFTNPIGDMERASDFVTDRMSLSGNFHGSVDFLKDFTFKTLFGFDIYRTRVKEPLEANPESYQARGDHQLTERASDHKLWNFTNTLNYAKTFGENHSVRALLGTEAISSVGSNIDATRTVYLLTNPDYWVLNAGEGVQTNSGDLSDWSTFSYFGNAHYGFKNRYLFDVVFRRDGSSRFGARNRYGNFPAAAAGWVVSEENFFNINPDALSYLKLRLSWGKSGNDQIGNYNGFTTFRTDHAFSSYPMDGGNNSLTTGFELLAFGNENAKWETTTSYNLGLDAILISRLNISVDLWKRLTNDMLYPRGIPAVKGEASAPSINIGDMENKGVDIELNYASSATKEFKYRVGLSFSHYRNTILRLTDDDSENITGPSYREHSYTRAEKGTSFPEFYGYNVLGIFQTQEEADAHAPFGSYNAPGRFQFEDVNGDGLINSEDRTYIGSPHPIFTSGLNANFSYKSVDLSVSFYASVGNKIANIVRRQTDFNFFQKNRSKRRLYESWGSPYLSDNSKATMPIAEVNDATSMLPSSYFIEDGSFLRLQSLQLGYTIPAQLSNQIKISNARIYVSATNLFTITNYTGLDPQIQTGGRSLGIDNGIWQTPKRFIIGLNFDL